MSNLPLQPLVFSKSLTAQSPSYEYRIRKDDESKDKYMVTFLEFNANPDEPAKEPARGFATIKEAESFVQKTHYPHTMQPYVKPTPTWIDASERLPEDDGKYLVATSCGKQWMGNYNLPPKPNEWMLNGWSMNGGWHPFDITHWMPIPEFSTMQNNKGE